MPTITPRPTEAVLIGVRDLAVMLGCSIRHIHRLVAESRIPPPVRLGALVRWRRAVIDEWLNLNCPGGASHV